MPVRWICRRREKRAWQRVNGSLPRVLSISGSLRKCDSLTRQARRQGPRNVT